MSVLSLAALLFDLDGTMVDTAPDLTAAANHMLRSLGRGTFDEATVASWIGDGVPRLIKRALTGERFGEPDPALFVEAQTLYNNYYEAHVADRSLLYPHVRETLGILQGEGFRLACVTNKAARFTQPLLQALGLDLFFEVVLSGDSLPRAKPDPLPLTSACQQLKVGLAGVALVGDSGNDMRAATAAAIPAIAVSYGYNHGVDLKELGATVITADFGTIPELVRFDSAFLLSRAMP